MEAQMSAEKKRRVIEEAKRIKNHAMEEYRLLEGSLEDGLKEMKKIEERESKRFCHSDS